MKLTLFHDRSVIDIKEILPVDKKVKVQITTKLDSKTTHKMGKILIVAK